MLRVITLIMLALSVTGCALNEQYLGNSGENPYAYPPFRGYPVYQGSRFTAVP